MLTLMVTSEQNKVVASLLASLPSQSPSRSFRVPSGQETRLTVLFPATTFTTPTTIVATVYTKRWRSALEENTT